MIDLRQALAGAHSASAEAAVSRAAFVIGNTGKLSEALLNVPVDSPRYSAVHVGVRKAMRTQVPKLLPMVVSGDLVAWDPCAGMKRAPEDLYLCIEPQARSFWKIPKPYVAITSPQAAAPVIRDTDELAILEAGFERMLGLRPIDDARRAAAVAVEMLASIDNGMQVMGAERLREQVGDPMEGKTT